MVSEAQKRATYKWTKNNLKRIPLDVRKEEYEQIKQYCDNNDLSVNGFIKDLIFNFLSDKNQD